MYQHVRSLKGLEQRWQLVRLDCNLQSHQHGIRNVGGDFLLQGEQLGSRRALCPSELRENLRESPVRDGYFFSSRTFQKESIN